MITESTDLHKLSHLNRVWVITLVFRCSRLYEQDEANVFAEPSVMSVHVLPYLLQMAEKYPQSSSLAQSLNSWAEVNAAQVLDNLAVCRELQPGATLACPSEYAYSHICEFSVIIQLFFLCS